jgi:uncharacterized protein YifN (PemK superfamily)
MKQYKLNSKTSSKTRTDHPVTTRQEIDSLTRQVSEHITKNPAKAAKLFENWLGQKPKSKSKRDAA